MNDLLQGLGQAVRRLRRDRGLSARALSARSGLSPRFLSELEAGRANISVRRLADLGRALGSSAAALLVDAERDGAAGASRRISLLGLRGAGKSTIGPRLAARLDLPFFELDALVENAAGLSLEEIFALHGEQYFRRLETDVLRRFLAEHDRGVLATGGGIVGNDEGFRLLLERTVTVWLRAAPDDHWSRVVRQGDLRPMSGRPAAQAELRRLLESREPLYARASHRVDTSRFGVAQCVRRLARELGRPV